MKKIIGVLRALFIFFIPVRCYAATDYNRQIDRITEEYNIPRADISEITLNDIITYIFQQIKNISSAPLRYTASLGSVIILCALAKTISATDSSFTENTVDSVCAVVIFLNLIGPFGKIISNISENLLSVKNFMAAFLPVFAGITAAAGKLFTSTVYTGFFLVGMLFFSDICLKYILPSVKLYFALTAANSMSSDIKLDSISRFYLKCTKRIMKGIVTAICLVLTLQTALFRGKDNIAVKAGKFLAGAAVPVIGSALQDAVSSVYAGMEAIKGFAGVAGIVGIICIFMPSFVMLAAYWLCTNFLYMLCDIFSVKNCGRCVKGFINVIDLVFSVVILFAVMLIFSLTIMISMTNGV